ncbi:MAG: resolvase, partial [Oscillospiraceae bacterium]|nr:resolvase [Oscillospiraceae bacterium]
FMELKESFLKEKSRVEQRLGKIDVELDNRERPQPQAELMEKARELLRLETVPRELVVGLVDKIEIGEKHPETGWQSVSITWKF